jgi:serine phosphatase RsbU (regulator of sigma subunit)
VYRRAVGDLTFSVLCLPYLAAFLAVAFLCGLVVVVRGDPVLRLAMLVISGTGVVWTGAFTLLGCTQDHDLAILILKCGYGPAAIAGPGLMMLVLGISGRFDTRRGVIALGFLSSLISAAICVSTNWVVKDVHQTPSGMLYTTPGWYQLIHVGHIPLWGVIGVFISRRGMRARDERARRQRQRAIWFIGLVSVTLMDSLLAHQIVGYYPVAWLPILAATFLAIYGIRREDMLKGRGIDEPAVLELAIMAAVLAFLVVVTWGGNRTWMGRPVVTAIFLAPLPMLALVAAWTMRIRRRRAERASDEASQAIDRFADEVRDLDDEAAVAQRLGELLSAYAPISNVRVWLLDEAGPRSLVPAAAAVPKIDTRVRAWLIANAEPLVVAELTTTRLGGLRALVEEVVERLDTDVVMPLVDRDTLVGLAVGELPPYRVLRDDERDFVRAVATTAARGLTFLALTREADHLASTAREVELAEAVAQARATGDVTVAAGLWQVLAHYRPAARVAGDVWSCADLGGGRLLVFAGDVVGRGVPSALVSAAVGGCADAAPPLAGPTLEPRQLLEVVHQTVRDLGGGTQRVTAFAALLDLEKANIKWACAGHRGAYLVHPPTGDGEDQRARLELLGARSSPLGEPNLVIAEGDRALGGDDHLVACSDGVVEVRDGRGEPWGDRRLQRMLRDQLVGAGDRAARMLVAAAIAHAGDAPVADDMLVVVVRPT